MSADVTSRSWESAVVWLRNQPDKRQLVLDAFYDDPLIAAAQRYFETAEWQTIAEILRGRNGTALDIGAGRGIASYALAREGFVVTALEPDPSAIVGAAAIRELARDAGLKIDVVEEFSERLPFADASFDVLFARAVLHHTSDLEKACQEFYRVLKPDGIFIAVREHVISKKEDLPKFLQRHPLHHLYGGEQAFLLERYVSALSSVGFSKLDVLAPLSSAINLYPWTPDSLRDEIIRRVSRLFPRALIAPILSQKTLFRCLLTMAGMLDARPGRLYSFVAYKAAP